MILLLASTAAAVAVHSVVDRNSLKERPYGQFDR